MEDMLDVYELSYNESRPVVCRLTDRGSVAEVFTDLNVWMGIRKVIEQINANAVA